MLGCTHMLIDTEGLVEAISIYATIWDNLYDYNLNLLKLMLVTLMFVCVCVMAWWLSPIICLVYDTKY